MQSKAAYNEGLKFKVTSLKLSPSTELIKKNIPTVVAVVHYSAHL
jgi:hypothetical protein